MDLLWDALLQMPGVGTPPCPAAGAQAAQAVPSERQVVVQAVGVPVNTREALRTFLQDPTARAEIEALRPPSAAVVRLLRILDVAIWIRHSHARPPAESAGRTASPSPGTAVRNTGYGRVFC